MRALAIGFIVFVISAILTQYLAYQRYLISKDAERKEITHEINTIKDRLKASLSHSLSATQTLAFIIKEYGVPKDFNSVAKQILSSNKFIDALQLTKGGIITHVYPLRGNEIAIGFNILNDSITSREAFEAIKKNELFFAGPLKLKQGGIGVVGRLPIFIDNNFWGFSVVLIKLSTLLRAAGIDTPHNKDFSYQLSKINPVTNKEEFFLPDTGSFQKEQSISLEVPDGAWRLYVSKKINSIFLSNVITVGLLGAVLSITAGFFAWYLAKQPERLTRLVTEKTDQLIASQALYRTTLERVSDAFVAYDKNCCFTFLNSKAAEILRVSPEKLIGKNLWQEFPSLMEQPIYEAYWKAIGTQQYVFIELHLIEKEKWYENHLYPSPDGLSVFFRDITDRKRAEEQIKQEKILSDSAINSLPGVFYLYDQTGTFIRWNKNFEIVSGYSAEEISRMHPLDFFHDDEKKILEEKIQLVFTMGSSDVQANLYTKQRKKIPYYFNGSKITFSGGDYLIGTGIDISARVAAENAMRERTDEIQKLTAHLQYIREEERTRIAREIHDELGQQLTGLKMDASWITTKIAKGEPVTEKLQGMVLLIDETVKTVRRISSELRPGILDDLGLIPALEWQGQEFEKRTGIQSSFFSDQEDLDVDRDLAINVFRVHQETLTNVARHAQATKIETTFEEKAGYIKLVIKDNGVGFNMEEAKMKKSLGLIGMRERALLFQGQLIINTERKRGTIITLKVPLKK